MEKLKGKPPVACPLCGGRNIRPHYSKSKDGRPYIWAIIWRVRCDDCRDSCKVEIDYSDEVNDEVV